MDSYAMPLDEWINTNPSAEREEPKFGGLTANLAEGGGVLIEWLGLKCVYLQSTADFVDWEDLSETAGYSSWTVPAESDASYFRLVEPEQ